MRRVAWALALTAIGACGASADENDLGGGALIAHYVADLTYTEAPGDACADYTPYAITSHAEQVTRVDVGGDYLSVIWYVLAAWQEEKVFKSVQFGLGDYENEGGFVAYWWGACAPGPILEINPTAEWPGPNIGTAVTLTNDEDVWSGNYVPVYYFAGYAYSVEMQIPLDKDRSILVPFGGFGNADAPTGIFSAAEYGILGINMDGYDAVPQPAPIDGPTWGTIKALYR